MSQYGDTPQGGWSYGQRGQSGYESPPQMAMQGGGSYMRGNYPSSQTGYAHHQAGYGPGGQHQTGYSHTAQTGYSQTAQTGYSQTAQTGYSQTAQTGYNQAAAGGFGIVHRNQAPSVFAQQVNAGYIEQQQYMVKMGSECSTPLGAHGRFDHEDAAWRSTSIPPGR